MSSDADARAMAKTKDIMINKDGCKYVGKATALATEGAVFAGTGSSFSEVDGGTGLINKGLAYGSEAYCKVVVKEQY